MMNSITIQQEICSKTFYNPSYPIFTKYGGLGYIIAHTLSHAFGLNIAQYLWRDNKFALSNYDHFYNCSISQYNNFSMMNYDTSIIKWNDLLVDGNKTFNENQADDWASNVVYNLFVKEMLQDDELMNFRLPGLNLTSEQLYFVSTAMNWCQATVPGYYNYANWIANNHHAPNPARVIVPNGNMKQFSQAFGCSSDSFMNFEQKCSFWLN